MHGAKVKIKWYYFHRLEVQSLINVTLKKYLYFVVAHKIKYHHLHHIVIDL
jgi:hypothetical protein